jgi:hypothetical protein
MDDISEFLLGPQRSSGSTMGLVLGLIAIAGALALLGYFGWCYFRERQIQKRVRERVKRQCGGNIVPTLPVSPDASALLESRSRTTGNGCEDRVMRHHRRRGRHPWKRRESERER